jgi:hypothetical protein
VFGGFDDTVLASPDGHTWEALPSTNHLGQQLVVANIERFGLFAVGQTAGSSPAAGTGGSQGVPVWVIALLAGLAIVAAIAAVIARRDPRPAGPRPEARRRRDDDRFGDPWKDD